MASLGVITAPTTPLVPMDVLRVHLRVDSAEEDALITAYLAAASAHIDGPAGWLGRSIGVQTLQLTGSGLCGRIKLPCGPVRSVASIDYVDPAGADATVPEADYRLVDDYLVLARGASWPALRGDDGGVRIRYEAGYGDPPPAIAAAVMLMTGDLYANREGAINGTISAEVKMSTTVEALLAPFRVWA